MSIKRLLGLADREIKRLYDLTEARYAQSPAVDLLNNLLYYVGRAESTGPRVTAVRASFRLNELLPVDDAVDQERESLSAPSVKLMQTVAAAIREDLGKVKDVLDIFVRRGSGQPQSLAPQVEMLRKIGDTLGVLGLGELRAAVQGETERLGKIVVRHAAAGAFAAGGYRRDADWRRRQARWTPGGHDPAARPRRRESAESGDADFQQVQSAVLRECILNLARLKESIAQSVGGTLDTAGLDAWPELMRGLKAGLLMLGKSRAVELVENIHARLAPLMQPGGAAALTGGRLDRLADAIVSLEYYMETLQAGRSDPWYMLDNAQACLDALEAQPAPAVPTVAPLEQSSFAQTVQIGGGAAAVRAQMEADLRHAGAAVPPVLATEVPVAAGVADPELLKLFVEEAREELARIATYFPVWEQNPLEVSALQNVRRSMHTLKGSGRMVGARDLSEFAWACENLLNRLLDNTLTRSPAIAATLHEAVAGLPQLVDALEHGTPVRFDAKALMARAHALAAAREGSEGTAPTTVLATQVLQGGRPYLDAPPSAAADLGRSATQAGAPAVPEDATGPEFLAVPELAAPTALRRHAPRRTAAQDDVLRDIYTRETNAHVATVREYLRQEQQRPQPHELTEAVYRACHTLSGSSTMAEARHGIRLAQPLDHWLRKSFDSGVGLTTSDLDVLGDCMTAMESVASHLDESTGYFVTHGRLLERLSEAEKDLDRRIADSIEAERRNALLPAHRHRRGGGRRQRGRPATAPPRPWSRRTPDSWPTSPSIWPRRQDNISAEEPGRTKPTQLIKPLDLCRPPRRCADERRRRKWKARRRTRSWTCRPKRNRSPISIRTWPASSPKRPPSCSRCASRSWPRWRDDPANAERPAALKRPLHTLKGGARMAGITAMGDLSHELESLVNFIDSGGVLPDAAAFDVLQASVDELARMRDSVAAGRGVAPARECIARIRALLDPGAAGRDRPQRRREHADRRRKCPIRPRPRRCPTRRTSRRLPIRRRTPEVPDTPDCRSAPAQPQRAVRDADRNRLRAAAVHRLHRHHEPVAADTGRAAAGAAGARAGGPGRPPRDGARRCRPARSAAERFR